MSFYATEEFANKMIKFCGEMVGHWYIWSSSHTAEMKKKKRFNASNWFGERGDFT